MTAVVAKVGTTGCSHFSPPSTTPTILELEKHEARCRQILECKKQIKVWQDKLNVLLAEQERYCMLTKLRLYGSSTWASLSPEDRLDKCYILAALESETLHESLQSFGEASFPLNIRTDRDIFLARLGHQDFETNFFENANLIVPPILRDDKDIMMKVVELQPLAIRTMPDCWRDDKDILLSVLRHPKLPKETLQYFTKEVRSDAELMFQVFQHPISEFSWIEHCSESLRENKQFLTRVVEGFQHVGRKKMVHNYHARNQILQYVSRPLQSDFEFVMACVRQSGMNLQYAGEDLQRNEEIVTAACFQSGQAIQFCSSVAVEKDLIGHKDFAERIFLWASSEVLQLCLERHGHEKEFCLHSLVNDHFEWWLIPEKWRSDVDFVAEAIELSYGSGRWWELLPPEMKQNFKVASRVSKIESLPYGILAGAINSCPEILSDRQVVKDLLSLHSYFGVDLLMPRILEISEIDIQNDKEIMLEAIKKQGGYWEHCSVQLRGDEDILSAAAEHFYVSLRILDNIYQLEHINFLVQVIQNHPKELDSIYKNVRPVLWQNREVAMAWLSSGGEWLDWRFPPQFIEDKEMILTAIKHHWFDFRKASDALKNDKAFVLEALEIDARVIRDADDCIFFDDEMVLAAFSRDIRAIQFYVEGDETCFAFLVAFAGKIRKRLREYRTFQDEFIAAITKSPKETIPGGCLLPMLNQGDVMLKTYENKIASYAGILVQEEDELARYESVSIHLAQWGI